MDWRILLAHLSDRLTRFPWSFLRSKLSSSFFSGVCLLNCLLHIAFFATRLYTRILWLVVEVNYNHNNLTFDTVS